MGKRQLARAIVPHGQIPISMYIGIGTRAARAGIDSCEPAQLTANSQFSRLWYDDRDDSASC